MHPTGQRLRCDDCGAEIVFTNGCPCPERDTKEHANKCCGKEMRILAPMQEPAPSGAPPGA